MAASLKESLGTAEPLRSLVMAANLGTAKRRANHRVRRTSVHIPSCSILSQNATNIGICIRVRNSLLCRYPNVHLHKHARSSVPSFFTLYAHTSIHHIDKWWVQSVIFTYHTCACDPNSHEEFLGYGRLQCRMRQACRRDSTRPVVEETLECG